MLWRPGRGNYACGDGCGHEWIFPNDVAVAFYEHCPLLGAWNGWAARWVYGESDTCEIENCFWSAVFQQLLGGLILDAFVCIDGGYGVSSQYIGCGKDVSKGQSLRAL